MKEKKHLSILLPATVICILAVTIYFQMTNGTISVSNTVNGKELPIYCVDTQEPKISISFDAAWGNDDTSRILEILAKHNVHATFFMTGGWVESYPDDVRAIYEAGHDLGNHSQNHKNMSQLSDTEIRDEIMSVHKKVKELTGYEMFLFRPPYGDYDNEVITGVLSCGYYPIQWSIDSLDWKDYGVDDIISRICDSKHLDGGAIILCHNGAKYTADALDNLLTQLQEKGLIELHTKGKYSYINALVSEDGYRENLTEQLVDEWYDGSALDLVANLYKDEKLTEEDKQKLRRMLDELDD